MKKSGFVYKEYEFFMFNNDTRGILLKNNKNVNSFYNIPKKVIEKIAERLDLVLTGEMCMHTGKTIYKAGKRVGDTGGLINMFSTTSKAKLNRFVVTHVNTAV